MDDLLNVFQIAIDATTEFSGETSGNTRKISLEDVIKRQEKALQDLEQFITIDQVEMVGIHETFEIVRKRITADNEVSKMYNRAQKIRVYLSYYVNKLAGDGDTKVLSVGSATYFKDDPRSALKHLLKKNARDLKLLKKAIPILRLGKITTGGKRKKTRINRRKNKRKNKTKQKRKAKKQNKTKQRQVRKPRHKRKHRITKKR